MSTVGHDRSTYLAWRQRFLPSPIRLIVVAESPPDGGLYFYRTDGSHTGETLFREMMMAIGATPASKAEGLEKFRAAGLLLVDATYTPVNKGYAPARRREIIEDGYPALVADLRSLMGGRRVPVVVIKTTLCDLLVPRLKANGFDLLNSPAIRPPFPSDGNQPKFRAQFGEALRLAEQKTAMDVDSAYRDNP